MASDLAQEALRPFAAVGSWLSLEWRDNDDTWPAALAEHDFAAAPSCPTVGDLRRARTAYDAIGSEVKADPVTPDLQWGKRTPEGSWLACNNRDKLAEIAAHFEGPIVPVTVEWDTNGDCKIEPALSTHTDAEAGPVGEAVAWRDMASAPKNATEIILRIPSQGWPDHYAQIGHWAQDLSGEEQPPFRGWFRKTGNGCAELADPTGWMPMPDAAGTAEEPGEVERLTRERDALAEALEQINSTSLSEVYDGRIGEIVSAAREVLAGRFDFNAHSLKVNLARETRRAEAAEAVLAETREAINAALRRGDVGSHSARVLRAALTGDAKEAVPADDGAGPFGGAKADEEAGR